MWRQTSCSTLRDAALHRESPVSAGPRTLPAMLFLHGNGSNADESQLANHVTWDGMGLLEALYESGNQSGAQAILCEEYLTILPLLPTGV